MPALTGLRSADHADRWRQAGFTVGDGTVTIGPVRIHTGIDGRDVDGITDAEGIVAIELDGGLDNATGPTAELDGLRLVPPDPTPIPTGTEHANRVVAIDHVVLATPDATRTMAAMDELGFELRRTRTVGSPGGDRIQAFYWAGSVIIELVGPAPTAQSAPSDEHVAPASVWGLALSCDDLDRAVEALGDLSSEPRPAVQAGRRIATIDTGRIGLSTTLALMSPHVAGATRA